MRCVSHDYADFSKAPFWIATSDGVVQPIHGEKDDDQINALANA